jgi:hypothetical protein
MGFLGLIHAMSIPAATNCTQCAPGTYAGEGVHSVFMAANIFVDSAVLPFVDAESLIWGWNVVLFRICPLMARTCIADLKSTSGSASCSRCKPGHFSETGAILQ